MKQITFILIVLISFSNYCQKDVNNNCSPEFPHAKKNIEFFLDIYNEKHSKEIGATNEKTSQIELVSDSKECLALRTFIGENKTYNQLNQKISDEETIYFYRTSNFYFVFWDYKPEFFRPRMGPPRPFIVINKDFTESWDFRL